MSTTASGDGAQAQLGAGDDPLLPAYRILLRIAREKKAQRRAAAESPPGAQKKRPAPQQAPASSSNPSTATAPLSSGRVRRA